MITILSYTHMRQQGATNVRFSAQNVFSVIQFSQNLMQQGWKNPSPFMQVPGFTKERSDKIKALHPKMSLY